MLERRATRGRRERQDGLTKMGCRVYKESLETTHLRLGTSGIIGSLELSNSMR